MRFHCVCVEVADEERNGCAMLTTPQAPINEQAPIGQGGTAPAQQQPLPQPLLQQPLPQQPLPQPPYAWQPAPPQMRGYAPVPQAAYMTPSSGQRMGLAIASLALLIPLFAISIGVINTLLPNVTAGVAITVGLIAMAFVCLVVVALNLLFNWDLLSRRR